MGRQEGLVRPLQEDAVLGVKDALQSVIQQSLQELVDVAFERIEGKVRQCVMAAATRVVPENVATSIDTVVRARTCSIDERLTSITVRLDGLEAKLTAAKLLKFGPAKRKGKRPKHDRRRS